MAGRLPPPRDRSDTEGGMVSPLPPPPGEEAVPGEADIPMAAPPKLKVNTSPWSSPGGAQYTRIEAL